ncbi:MAG: hypothetical protein JW942_08320 [Opitutales bacterium]|nr:hypothetical protein [Opitutales bacterium]
MKIPHYITSLALAATAIGFGGCASIVDGGRNETVLIRSLPAGASIKIVNNRTGETVYSGTSPAKVDLARSSGFFKGVSYTIQFRLDGYDDKQVSLRSSVNGWYFGNIIFGGLIGMVIVDPATGAMYSLPEDVVANLDAKSSATLLEDGDNANLLIVNIDDIPEELRSQLVAVN